MAHYEDLEVDQGSDAKWQIQMLNADGSARDLTDYSVRGFVSRSYSADSDESFAFITNILPPETSGVIEFRLSNEQTDSMNLRRYVYDLEVEFVDDDNRTVVERVLEGNLIVSRSVSRFD